MKRAWRGRAENGRAENSPFGIGVDLGVHDILLGALDQLANPVGLPAEDAGEERHAHALEAVAHVAAEEGSELLVAGAAHPGVEADVLAGLDDVDAAEVLEPLGVVLGVVPAAADAGGGLHHAVAPLPERAPLRWRC